MSSKDSDESSDSGEEELVEDWLTSDSILLEEVADPIVPIIKTSSSSSGSSGSYISRTDSNTTSGSGSSSDGSSGSVGSDESGMEQFDVEDWLAEEDEENGGMVSSLQSAQYTSDSMDGQHYLEDIELTVNPESLALAEQKEFLHQLCAIADLQFDTLKPRLQLKLMKSLQIMDVTAGDVLIQEGDSKEDGSFYFILGPADAQVEVVRQIDGKEEFLTRINAGQYFGEKYFITNRHAPRNATIRAVRACTLGCVPTEQFSLWTHFRTFLLMKEVPLIRTLPQNFQVEMYSLLKHAAYADGDYIVKQGDVGDKFYIITDGAADVVQEKFENDKVERKTLVRLYEGHFFGEMALVFDEPRVASVFAVGKTSCLTLSKGAFTKALSAEQFQVMMQDVAYQRAEVREKREKKEQAEIAAKATISRITSSNSDMPISMNSIASIAPLFSRNASSNHGGGTSRSTGNHSGWDSDGGSDSERNVTTTNKLVKRKLATGQKFINKYIILKEIGRGAFGYVYLCKNEEDEQLYAMKSISKATRKWNMKLTDDVKTEIAVMKSLRHQNVVSLLEVIDDPTAKQIYLVQEYMECGALIGDEWNAEPIPEKKVWGYFRDMLRGVSYMHSQGIVHRDIKPQNMLRSADDVVKLADFGTAVLTGGDDGSVVLAAGGTPAFMAPELFQVASKDNIETHERVVSPQVDVWGLGATLYNLVIGNPPWSAKNQILLAEMVKNIELRFPYEKEQTMDPHMKHLIKRMLDKDPKTRITMAEICLHDWVTREGVEPLDEDYLYNLLNPANLANLGGVSKAIFQMNTSFSASNASLGSHIGSSDQSFNHSSFGDSMSGNGSGSGSGLKNPSFNKHNSAYSNLSDFSGDDDTDSDSDAPPPTAPRMQRLSSTKNQEFVAKLADYKTDTGEVVTGVLLTNNKFSGSSALETSTLSNWNNNALDKKNAFNHSSCDLSVSSFSVCPSDTDDDIDDSFHGSMLKRSVSAAACMLGRSSSFRQLTSPNAKVAISPAKSKTSTFEMDLIAEVDTVLSDVNSCSDSSDAEGIKGKTEFALLKDKFRRNLLKKETSISRSISLDMAQGNLSSSEDEVDAYTFDRKESPKHRKKLKKKKVKQEEDSSDDDVESLDGDALDGMLDMLCEVTPNSQSLSVLQNKETGDISIEKRSNDPLFRVKTWAGQTNLSLGVRYGIAEMRNSRAYMEDRITACGSFLGAEKKKMALLTLSDDVAGELSEEDDALLLLPPPPMIGGEHFVQKPEPEPEPPTAADFSFFAVYDGHEGEYVSEYLQQNLHFRFNEKLLLNGGLPVLSSDRGSGSGADQAFSGGIEQEDDDCAVRISLLEACCAMEREILMKDSLRLQSRNSVRVECLKDPTLDWEEDDDNDSPRSRSNSEDSESVQHSSSPKSRKRISRGKSKTKKKKSLSKDSKKHNSSKTKSKSVLCDSGSANFAGSTAVVAIMYNGIIPGQAAGGGEGDDEGGGRFRRHSSGRASSKSGTSSSDEVSCLTSDSFSDLNLNAPMNSSFKLKKFGSFLGTIEEPGESRDDLDSDGILLVDDIIVSDESDQEEENKEGIEKSYKTLANLSGRLSGRPIHKTPPVKLLVAHVGDCRAVLSVAGVAVQLTEDHHPDVPSEKTRVEAAGGWIAKNRVNGVLAVTRSFGDIMYKNFDPNTPSPDFYGDEEEMESGIWAKKNQVISMPEILELDVLPSYEFVILASDGLFEIFSCSQIVSFVRDELFKHGDSQRAARAAIKAVETQGGHDNTSVVIICMNQVTRDRRTAGNSVQSSGGSGPTTSSTGSRELLRHAVRTNSGSGTESFMSDI